MKEKDIKKIDRSLLKSIILEILKEDTSLLKELVKEVLEENDMKGSTKPEIRSQKIEQLIDEDFEKYDKVFKSLA